MACPVLVASAVEVAVIVAVSAPVDDGVNVTAVPEAMPDEALNVPPPLGLRERFTVFANAPVPVTVGVQLVVCALVIVDGLHTSVTAVIVGAAPDRVTATTACPVLVASAVEVAVIVAVSAPVEVGVNVTAVPESMPDEALNVPPPAGLTERFTVFANAPVPVTVGVQLVVCAFVIVDGLHTSVTAVIVGGTTVTVIFAEPETFVYPACAELAMQLAFPALAEGVNTPAEVMVPPVADQVTALL
jgi:hypothetical protein